MILIKMIQSRIRAKCFKPFYRILDNIFNRPAVFCNSVEYVQSSAIHTDIIKNGFSIINSLFSPYAAFSIPAAFWCTDQDQDSICPGLKGF